jgi:hypothetical protein
VIKSRRAKWAGHLACIEEMTNKYKIVVGNTNERSHSVNLGVNGKLISVRILGKQGGKLWTGFIWLRIGASGGLL